MNSNFEILEKNQYDEFAEAYKTMAMIYIESSQLEKAKEIAKKAIENPNIENDASIFHIAATAYMLEKNHQNARKKSDKCQLQASCVLLLEKQNFGKRRSQSF